MLKHGKKIISMLLVLAMFATMSVVAMADDIGDNELPVVVVSGDSEKMAVVCKDSEGNVLRDSEDDYLDLSKDVVIDSNFARPEIADFTYSKTMIGDKEVAEIKVAHDADEQAVITALYVGEEEASSLTGEETIIFVYDAVVVSDPGEDECEHVWDEGTVTKEAHCDAKGEKTFTCTKCGNKKIEEIPMCEHEWGEWKESTAPTCENKGVEVRTCPKGENGSHSQSRDVDALGHDWGEATYAWAEDNSTCAASHTCKREGCKKVETETVKPAETVTKEPTCLEKGEKTLKATFTSKDFAEQSKIVEVKALGHEYAHGHCKRCDALDPNFKPKASDETSGRANWGSDYKMISDAARKDFKKVMVDGKDVDPANYTVSEKDGNTVVVLKGSFIKTLSVGNHQFDIVSSTGTATRTVSVSEVPKTGDEGIGLWIGLLALSTIGLAAVGFAAKKKFSAC